MRSFVSRLTIAITCFVLVACGDKEQVERISGGYELVTSATRLNPDYHPGTALRRGTKIIWGNIYTGYFQPAPANSFTHDGMMLFVGPVPDRDNWYVFSQLFAVRGDGPPVVLSERLLQKHLVASSIGNEGSVFAVKSLSLVNGGFRVVFTQGAEITTREITWDDIKRLLDEADTKARSVHHHLGDYKILPTNNASNQNADSVP